MEVFSSYEKTENPLGQLEPMGGTDIPEQQECPNETYHSTAWDFQDGMRPETQKYIVKHVASSSQRSRRSVMR